MNLPSDSSDDDLLLPGSGPPSRVSNTPNKLPPSQLGSSRTGSTTITPAKAPTSRAISKRPSHASAASERARKLLFDLKLSSSSSTTSSDDGDDGRHLSARHGGTDDRRESSTLHVTAEQAFGKETSQESANREHVGLEEVDDHSTTTSDDDDVPLPMMMQQQRQQQRPTGGLLSGRTSSESGSGDTTAEQHQLNCRNDGVVSASSTSTDEQNEEEASTNLPLGQEDDQKTTSDDSGADVTDAEPFQGHHYHQEQQPDAHHRQLNATHNEHNNGSVDPSTSLTLSSSDDEDGGHVGANHRRGRINQPLLHESTTSSSSSSPERLRDEELNAQQTGRHLSTVGKGNGHGEALGLASNNDMVPLNRVAAAVFSATISSETVPCNNGDGDKDVAFGVPPDAFGSPDDDGSPPSPTTSSTSLSSSSHPNNSIESQELPFGGDRVLLSILPSAAGTTHTGGGGGGSASYHDDDEATNSKIEDSEEEEENRSRCRPQQDLGGLPLESLTRNELVLEAQRLRGVVSNIQQEAQLREDYFESMLSGSVSRDELSRIEAVYKQQLSAMKKEQAALEQKCERLRSERDRAVRRLERGSIAGREAPLHVVDRHVDEDDGGEHTHSSFMSTTVSAPDSPFTTTQTEDDDVVAGDDGAKRLLKKNNTNLRKKAMSPSTDTATASKSISGTSSEDDDEDSSLATDSSDVRVAKQKGRNAKPMVVGGGDDGTYALNTTDDTILQGDDEEGGEGLSWGRQQHPRSKLPDDLVAKSGSTFVSSWLKQKGNIPSTKEGAPAFTSSTTPSKKKSIVKAKSYRTAVCQTDETNAKSTRNQCIMATILVAPSRHAKVQVGTTSPPSTNDKLLGEADVITKVSSSSGSDEVVVPKFSDATTSPLLPPVVTTVEKLIGPDDVVCEQTTKTTGTSTDVLLVTASHRDASCSPILEAGIVDEQHKEYDADVEAPSASVSRSTQASSSGERSLSSSSHGSLPSGHLFHDGSRGGDERGGSAAPCAAVPTTTQVCCSSVQTEDTTATGDQENVGAAAVDTSTQTDAPLLEAEVTTTCSVETSTTGLSEVVSVACGAAAPLSTTDVGVECMLTEDLQPSSPSSSSCTSSSSSSSGLVVDTANIGCNTEPQSVTVSVAVQTAAPAETATTSMQTTTTVADAVPPSSSSLPAAAPPPTPYVLMLDNGAQVDPVTIMTTETQTDALGPTTTGEQGAEEKGGDSRSVNSGSNNNSMTRTTPRQASADLLHVQQVLQELRKARQTRFGAPGDPQHIHDSLVALRLLTTTTNTSTSTSMMGGTHRNNMHQQQQLLSSSPSNVAMPDVSPIRKEEDDNDDTTATAQTVVLPPEIIADSSGAVAHHSRNHEVSSTTTAADELSAMLSSHLAEAAEQHQEQLTTALQSQQEALVHQVHTAINEAFTGHQLTPLGLGDQDERLVASVVDQVVSAITRQLHDTRNKSLGADHKDTCEAETMTTEEVISQGRHSDMNSVATNTEGEEEHSDDHSEKTEAIVAEAVVEATKELQESLTLAHDMLEQQRRAANAKEEEHRKAIEHLQGLLVEKEDAHQEALRVALSRAQDSTTVVGYNEADDACCPPSPRDGHAPTPTKHTPSSSPGHSSSADPSSRKVQTPAVPLAGGGLSRTSSSASSSSLPSSATRCTQPKCEALRRDFKALQDLWRRAQLAFKDSLWCIRDENKNLRESLGKSKGRVKELKATMNRQLMILERSSLVVESREENNNVDATLVVGGSSSVS